MLRNAMCPAVGNVMRGGRASRSLERKVAMGSGGRYYLSDLKLPPGREKSLAQNDEMPTEEGKKAASAQQIEKEVKQKNKTMAELDEELRLKLEGVSGEGGTAGVEYEGGKAVGLKRGVKENMFRII
ncbi:hypothetical protein N431DRAFT_46353 [Stipitochalara longipes BDJ]|nr:hypothetical protein N431DRAFT_46353 [Stipitochalara longipes BDJ]